MFVVSFMFVIRIVPGPVDGSSRERIHIKRAGGSTTLMTIIESMFALDVVDKETVCCSILLNAHCSKLTPPFSSTSADSQRTAPFSSESPTKLRTTSVNSDLCQAELAKRVVSAKTTACILPAPQKGQFPPSIEGWSFRLLNRNPFSIQSNDVRICTGEHAVELPITNRQDRSHVDQPSIRDLSLFPFHTKSTPSILAKRLAC